MAEPPLLACWREEFELNPPWLNARASWQRRSILLVRLCDASGRVGHGEAAPLPGYSPDTLDASEQALLAIPQAELEALSELSAPRALLAAVTALVPAQLPAARFALETALLDRLARRQGRPLWALLRELLSTAPGPVSAVALCALLPGHDPALALREAARHFEQGVRTFKLKLGPERLQPAQAELLAALRSRFGNQIELRLDANQTLHPAQLAATFAGLLPHRPQFVEEPLADPRPELLAGLACSWALDESLRQLDPERLARLTALPGCRALVLKPSTLGGVGGCAPWAERARALGKLAVVSHTLEGPLGWLACAQFALALGSSAAAGLWPTARRAAVPTCVAGGRLHAPDGHGLGGAP